MNNKLTKSYNKTIINFLKKIVTLTNKNKDKVVGWLAEFFLKVLPKKNKNYLCKMFRNLIEWRSDFETGLSQLVDPCVAIWTVWYFNHAHVFY